MAQVSAGLNYAVYAGLLVAFPALRTVIATALASLIAMAASYFGYSRLVFRES